MKKKEPPPPMLYLNRDEYSAAQLALERLVVDTKGSLSNPDYPWTAEARKMQKEIIAGATSALQKISKLTGLPIGHFDQEITQADIDEFTTKPS